MRKMFRSKFPEWERQKITELASQTLDTDEGKEALRYLTDKRHLSIETIKTYRLGYMPFRVDHELHGRLIIPLCNPFDDGIRVLSSRDFRPNAKMKHFHESFKKSGYLYGVRYALRHIIEQDSVIIVEGEFDCMRLHTAGIKNTVALLGSSVSLIQLAQIRSFTDHFIFCFDGDDAGIHATKARAIEKIKQTTKVDFINLPDGYDPDSYVSEYGKDNFLNLIKNKETQNV